MIEKLHQWDVQLFVYLNSLGSDTWDPVWEIITKQVAWIPVFAIVIYLAFKRLGWKHALMVVGVVGLTVLFTDQTTNLVKNTVQRLRPGNNPEIATVVRAVIKRHSFSFFSGHAANSMAVAVLVYRVLHPYLKYIGFFFLWPLIFAYSRIYLGLHYPGDILTGYIFGAFMGWLMSLLYAKLRDKYFPQHERLDNPTNSKPISNG
ncbi:phosphatase PAP2 family protein [Flavobacterium sp. RNTU_13]|uniref:phosphatase PAP2 family protein n=1 Tax=Flavobacterium sp. RNTU_13 TaxID=3375145 RepID=UPI003987BF43